MHHVSEFEIAREDDRRFRHLVESISDYAIFMLNPQGQICSWNQGAERIKGYAKEEVLGQHISIFYTPEAVEEGKPQADLQQALSLGHCNDEGWRLRRDGSRFWASIVITALFDANGKLDGYSKITKDMTDRKRLEERFRRVVEAAPNAMVMVNSGGRIEMVNAQTERLFGYTREELIGESVEILVPEQFRHKHPQLRDMFFHNPQSRPMGAGRDLFGRRKDNTEFPVEIGLNPIETEEGIMVLSSIVDISERKRLEQRFQLVVESAPNAMVMVNRQGRIEMVNAQAEQLFGYLRSEMLGNPVEMLVPERFRRQHPEKRNMFFNDPKSRPMGAGRDLFGRRKDGSEFPIEIGLNPIETGDGAMVLSAIVDISDRKQKEMRIEVALKEKNFLLGEIHHRVKNNLQIIYSLLDLQASRINDPVVQDMLLDSQNRVRSMALIHQTLYQSNDFAKVEFGSFLETLVPTLMATYGINSKNIRLKVDVSPVHLPINLAIPCGLLMNELITNALKHGFPDGATGEIVVGLSQNEQGKVMLFVSDDGVGIPEELNFEQSETLGLSLITLLAHQIKGSLTIHRHHPTRFLLDFLVEDI